MGEEKGGGENERTEQERPGFHGGIMPEIGAGGNRELGGECADLDRGRGGIRGSGLAQKARVG